MTLRLTRRQALLGAIASTAGATGLTGCGTSGDQPAADGSTLHSTWIDPTGDGQLQVGPGEPFVARTELGTAAGTAEHLATLAHITDAHVLDPSSPARVPFLARLGPPLQSTFRPQEALTAQVMHGALTAIGALRPDVVVEGGDLIDNDQSNELDRALTLLRGGTVHPGSGRDGYYGVQSPFDSDPFYYRPDIDAPRYPGMLHDATRPFSTPGLNRPWLPVLGDHDVLVAGELVPDALTESLAVGDRALWNLPTGLSLPAGLRLNPTGSPDGPPDPAYVAEFLRQALAGPTVRVPADPARYELQLTDVIARLRSAARTTAPATSLDYVRDVGGRLRIIVLDLARRDGGSGGLVRPGQPEWVQAQLADAGERWVIVASHQPLAGSAGGDLILDVLDRAPRVVATLAGHIHRNQIVARPTPAGGYWQIVTASLIDFPQQARAVRLLATDGGGVAVQTWMLDHVEAGPLATFSRQLSYLDAQGGRPRGFRGTRQDRNVTLYRRAVT